MILVDSLSYEYPNVRALEDVSFHIPADSITALVGPNGAGKTTLLRCLAALDRPFSGTASVNGLDTQEDPRGVHRSMGYLSDFFGLYDELTIYQTLEYMARAHGAPTSQIEKTIARIGLNEYSHTKAKALSRGLRQRLAIGQAILHEPRVVLLDEPASGLDPEARIALGKLFLALRDEGMTLVVSSHILSELEQYATDILILRAGRILEHRSIERPGNRQPFHLQLLNADPRLGQILADHGDVSELEIQENEAHFLFSGDGAAQHRLLTELISRGLSVCSFSPARVSLQDTYLSKVRTLDGEQSI